MLLAEGRAGAGSPQRAWTPFQNRAAKKSKLLAETTVFVVSLADELHFWAFILLRFRFAGHAR